MLRRLSCALVVLWVLMNAVSCADSALANSPTSILPTGRVDPAAFVGLRREDFAAGEAEVHAVFVYGTKLKEAVPQGSGTPSAVFPYPGHPPIDTIQVQVALTGRPMILLLGAYESTHWKLDIPSGARVEKVIAQGFYQQFVSGLPPGVKLLTYFTHPPAGIDGLFFSSEPGLLYRLFENVRRLTGRRPTTLQCETVRGKVVIDGVTTIAQPTVETAFEPGRPVVLGLTPMSGSRISTGRPTDELSIKFCCEQDYTTVKATRAFARGRIYFEATIALPEGGAGEQTNVGLLSAPPSESSRLLAAPGHLGGYGFPLLDRSARAALRNGDVIGVAADLDSGRLFFHINGRWIRGPSGGSGSHSAGIELRRGEEYVAAVSLTPDPRGPTGRETWEVNFGATPFRYGVPQGYTAYNAHPGGMEVYTSMRNQRWTHRILAWPGDPGAHFGTGDAPRPRTMAQERPIPISTQGEVHAIGVYEGGPSGVSIKVTRTGAPIALLLMAYSPVAWKLEVAPGVVLEKVVAMGYHEQKLQGVPVGVDAVSWSRENPDPRAFYYYGKPEGRDDFERRVRTLFGKEAASFQGAYRASQATVDGASRALSSPRHAQPVVIQCGGTTIVCGEGQDRIICGGREIICR